MDVLATFLSESMTHHSALLILVWIWILQIIALVVGPENWLR